MRPSSRVLPRHLIKGVVLDYTIGRGQGEIREHVCYGFSSQLPTQVSLVVHSAHYRVRETLAGFLGCSVFYIEARGRRFYLPYIDFTKFVKPLRNAHRSMPEVVPYEQCTPVNPFKNTSIKDC